MASPIIWHRSFFSPNSNLISWGGPDLICLAWIPEGIMLTPKHAAAPHGYGLPKRSLSTGETINAPYGTAITSASFTHLNQVLLNRYQNNKYLDRPEHIKGLSLSLPDNKQLRTSLSGAGSTFPRYINHSYIFEPTDDTSSRAFWDDDTNRTKWVDQPGIDKWIGGLSYFAPMRAAESPQSSLMLRQFDSDRQSLIYEDKAVSWFCHWPEEQLYENVAFETIFKTTNDYRVAVGRDPIFRQLRGEPTPAPTILYEIQRASVLYHDNEALFRPGYTNFDKRIRRVLTRGSWHSGENLAFSPVPEHANLDSAATGAAMTEAWRNSTHGHYEAMISQLWDPTDKSSDPHGYSGGGVTSLYVSGGLPATITEDLYTGTIDPPEAGHVFTEVFVQSSLWVASGSTIWDSLLGPIGCRYVSPIGAVRPDENTYIVLHGKAIVIDPFKILMQDGYQVNILGATVFRNVSGQFLFRVLALVHPADILNFGESFSLLSVISPVDNQGIWEVECQDDAMLSDSHNVWRISSFTFSADGENAIGTLSRTVVDEHPTMTPSSNTYAQTVFSEHLHVTYSLSAFTMEPARAPVITASLTGTGYSLTGNDHIDTYPAYVKQQNGSYVVQYSTLSLVVDITQNGGDSNYVLLRNTLTLPSGKELIIQDVEILESGEIGSAYYFLIFFYLDIARENYIYARLDVTGDAWATSSNGGKVLYGTLKFYANDTLLYTSDTVRVDGWDDPSVSPAAIDHPLSLFNAFGWNIVPSTWINPGAGGSIVGAPDVPWNPVTATNDFTYFVVGDYPVSIGARVGQHVLPFGRTINSVREFNSTFDMGLPVVIGIDDNPYVQTFPEYRSGSAYGNLRDMVARACYVEYDSGYVAALNIKNMFVWDFVTEDSPNGLFLIDSSLPIDQLIGFTPIDVFPMGLV